MHGNDPVFHEDRPPGHPPDISTALLRIAAFFAVGLLLASQLPVALVGVAISQFLTVAAFATATVAAILRQPLFAPILTRWDEAAILGVIAMLAAIAVDPDAAQKAAESLAVTGIGGSS